MCGGGVNELKKGDRMSFHYMLIYIYIYFFNLIINTLFI
jgi:hypothetical protein